MQMIGVAMENEVVYKCTETQLRRRVKEAIKKEKRVLFDLHLEKFSLLPTRKRVHLWRKGYVIIPEAEWDRFEDEDGQLLGDLETARRIIETEEPVFLEYCEEYCKKHAFSLEQYLNAVIAQYTSEEFERVRERYEEEYNRRLDEEMGEEER